MEVEDFEMGKPSIRGVLATPTIINGTTVLADLGIKYTDKGRHKRSVVVECECGDLREVELSTVKRQKHLLCRWCRASITGRKLTRNTYRGSLYSRWANMKARCSDTNRPDYSRYGGKGVTVCEEWINSYEKFKLWALSNGYRKELVLDKDFLCELKGISPKIYSPETCQWITPRENSIMGANNANKTIAARRLECK